MRIADAVCVKDEVLIKLLRTAVLVRVDRRETVDGVAVFVLVTFGLVVIGGEIPDLVAVL